MRRIQKNGETLLTGKTGEMIQMKRNKDVYSVDEKTFDRYKKFWDVDEDVVTILKGEFK